MDIGDIILSPDKPPITHIHTLKLSNDTSEAPHSWEDREEFDINIRTTQIRDTPSPALEHILLDSSLTNGILLQSPPPSSISSFNPSPDTTLTSLNTNTSPPSAHKISSPSPANQISQNHVALSPDILKHHSEIWSTRLEFNIPMAEQIQEGIRVRLLSFLPTAIAKCQGSILPCEPASNLPPSVRDLHTVITQEVMDKYFHYDITVGRRIRGWLKLHNTDPNTTFSSLKFDHGIIKKALNSYPLFWNQTALTTSNSTTPIFLACVGRHINLKQLKQDLTSHANINFPIDLIRKPQLATGYIPTQKEPTTISAQVIKISCAKDNAQELQNKLFSSLGNKVPFAPEHQLTCLPYLKVMVTWKHGAYSEQMIFDTVCKQKAYEEHTSVLEIHHIKDLSRTAHLRGDTKTLHEQLAAFSVQSERVVFSVDRANNNKIWITVSSQYVREYMDYLNLLLHELNTWRFEDVYNLTGCYSRPCWNTDIQTLTTEAQQYISRENLNNLNQDYPPLPLASRQYRSSATSKPQKHNNPKQNQIVLNKTASISNTSSLNPPASSTPTQHKDSDPSLRTEVTTLNTMITALQQELSSVKHSVQLMQGTTSQCEHLQAQVKDIQSIQEQMATDITSAIRTEFQSFEPRR